MRELGKYVWRRKDGWTRKKERKGVFISENDTYGGKARTNVSKDIFTSSITEDKHGDHDSSWCVYRQNSCLKSSRSQTQEIKRHLSASRNVIGQEK